MNKNLQFANPWSVKIMFLNTKDRTNQAFWVAVLACLLLCWFAALPVKADDSFQETATGIAGQRRATGFDSPPSPVDVLAGPFSSYPNYNTGVDVRIYTNDYEYLEYRFALEFPLSQLPEGCPVTGAILRLRTSDDRAGQTRLSAYSGDGSPTLDDLLVSSSYTQLITPSTVSPTNYDVTALVQAIVAQNATHFGVMVEQYPLPTEPLFLEIRWDGPNNSSYPQLTVTHDDCTPQCNGQAPTISVVEGIILGGPDDGKPYAGTLKGTNGSDIILGTNGDDTIIARGGADLICSLAGDDLIKAGGGPDWIDAGSGADLVQAQGGNDTIDCGTNGSTGRFPSDMANGGPGNDSAVNCTITKNVP